MNVIHGNHRAYVEEDLGSTAAHPFGGLLLSTGEAVGYDDQALDVEPGDDAWDNAHDPDWAPDGACRGCGQRRLSASL